MSPLDSMVAPVGAAKQAPVVWAIIPTYRRAELLARTLASLRNQRGLAGVIIANNSSDPATAAVARACPIPATVLDFGRNMGLAGGIGVGLRAMLRETRATHAWILDDDVVAQPGALAAMLDAADRAGADAVAPLLTDAAGKVRWFPAPLSGRAWDLIRATPTPEEFVAAVGSKPRSFNWAIWASVLISRRAIEAVGYPRLDLWFAFTDIEYVLRISARFKCVLAPNAVCEHLQPVSTGAALDEKIFWGLQHANVVSVRLRHGWRALRHLPGHQLRFLRHYRWRPRAWWDVVRAFVGGAVLGRTSTMSTHMAQFQAAVAVFPEWNTGAAVESSKPGVPG